MNLRSKLYILLSYTTLFIMNLQNRRLTVQEYDRLLRIDPIGNDARKVAFNTSLKAGDLSNDIVRLHNQQRFDRYIYNALKEGKPSKLKALKRYTCMRHSQQRIEDRARKMQRLKFDLVSLYNDMKIPEHPPLINKEILKSTIGPLIPVQFTEPITPTQTPTNTGYDQYYRQSMPREVRMTPIVQYDPKDGAYSYPTTEADILHQAQIQATRQTGGSQPPLAPPLPSSIQTPQGPPPPAPPLPTPQGYSPLPSPILASTTTPPTPRGPPTPRDPPDNFPTQSTPLPDTLPTVSPTKEGTTSNLTTVFNPTPEQAIMENREDIKSVLAYMGKTDDPKALQVGKDIIGALTENIINLSSRDSSLNLTPKKPSSTEPALKKSPAVQRVDRTTAFTGTYKQ